MPRPVTDWYDRFLAPSGAVDLASISTTWVPDQLYGESVEEWAKSRLSNLSGKLEAAQLRLFAHRRQRLLVILQGIDTAGKDGLIRHVFSAVNPVGLNVTSFGPPSEEERRHDFLWRMRRALPEPGHVGVFNRSYYEQLMHLRVHPEHDEANLDHYQTVTRQILGFEQTLMESHVGILKVFLHLSRTEQARRLVKRAQRPERRWKLTASDLRDHELWDAHMRSFEEAVETTHTPQAPWYVVPADNKWVARVVVAELVLRALQEMAPDFPQPTAAQLALCEEVCARLRQTEIQ